jgi:hypothetical protein
MEEATELFGTMQGMLRASETARQALAARPAVPAATPATAAAPRTPVAAGPATAPGDDLFLVGLLTMGAGAGLLAAMARRLAEGAPPAPASGTGRTPR